MLSFLKNHPFEVEAFFERSLVLTFAVPKEQLQHLIPKCLQLDTFSEKWAFLAVAMVQTKDLRPRGWPKFMGNDFFLIGYRIFVRYMDSRCKSLRGLYILRSETDKKKMEFFGNMFTHYNYMTTDIHCSDFTNSYKIESHKSNFSASISKSKTEFPLPGCSPFADWKTARRFAGPLPYTFTYNATKNEVLIIEGVRESWTPEPVKVIDYNFSLLSELRFENAVLANAFIINTVPYYWKKGRIEIWKI